MKEKIAFSIKLKIILMMLAILCLWGGLIFRLFVLQVKEAPQLAMKAERQHGAVLRVASRRGRILDRNQNILAVSVKV